MESERRQRRCDAFPRCLCVRESDDAPTLPFSVSDFRETARKQKMCFCVCVKVGASSNTNMPNIHRRSQATHRAWSPSQCDASEGQERGRVIMSPEDEFDIRESFHVMDEERTGEIDMNQFETLCLGLGYDVERKDLETLILRQIQRLDGGITVDVVLNILCKV